MTEDPKKHPDTVARRRILVVDDEESVARAVVETLKAHGFDASAVNDPTEVPQRVAEFHPNLIILDFDMPKLLGPDLAVLLKSRSETREIPVVFLSGMTDEDHHTIGTFSGAAAYLDKPVDPPKLIETIRALLINA